MVCTDIILFNKIDNDVFLLLIKRLNEPFKDKWALPGGFVDENEDLIDAAKRELLEETSVTNLALEQFKTYGTPGRDPRGHTVSVVYYVITNKGIINPKAGDDARETEWFNIKSLPKLAFDHDKIIEEAINELLA